MLDLLSRPKPASFEWWLSRAAEATVVGSTFDESRAIYLWLQLDGVPEPRAYALPWDQRVAEQLQTAARDRGRAAVCGPDAAAVRDNPGRS